MKSGIDDRRAPVKANGGSSLGPRLDSVMMLRMRLAALIGLFALAGCATGSRGVVSSGVRSAVGTERELPDRGLVDVLEEEGRFVFDADGVRTYTYRLKYRVEQPELPTNWARFEVRWSPKDHERPDLSVSVETPSGAVEHVDPQTIMEEQWPNAPEDRKLSADIPSLVPGAVVERTVTYRDRAPPPLGLVSGRYALGMSVPIRRSVVIFDAPIDLGLRVYPRGFEARTHVSEAEGRRVTHVETKSLPGVWTGEPLVPPSAPRVPHVAFTSAGDWSDWGSRWAQVVEAWQSEAGPSPIEPTLDRVFTTWSWVQAKLRWQEGPLKPQPRSATEILASGGGDALELALVFRWLMGEQAASAQVALLKRGLAEDVQPAFPEGGALDHALIYLPDLDVFLDLTDPNTRPGELPVLDQGRLALLVEPTGGRLVRTPTVDARANRYREARVLDLTASPELTFTEETVASGSIEARLRRRFARSRGERVRRQLSDYLNSSYRGGRLERMQIAGAEDIRQTLEIRLSGRGGGVVQSEDGTTKVFVSAPVLFTWLPKPIRDATLAEADSEQDRRFAASLLATRSVDVEVPEPYVASVSFEIIVPDSLVLRSRPEDTTVSLGPALYHQAVKKTARGYTVDLGFVLDQRRMTADEARVLVGGLRELWAQPVPRLEFEDLAHTDFAADRVKAGMERLIRDASAPGAAGPLRLARALMDEHLGVAAHRWARMAVDRAPDDPATLAEASRILAHGELGEEFGPGFARDEAIQLMRQARTGLRGLGDSNLGLARLLAVDARGLPNEEPAELEEAVVLLKATVERRPTPEAIELLAQLLFRVGRAAELLQLAEGWPRSFELDALRVACWVRRDGVDPALERLAELDLPSQVAVMAVDRASHRLIEVQAYELAGRLLERIEARSPEPERVRERAELFRRIAKGLRRDVQGPAQPVYRLQTLLAGAPGVESIEPLFTPSAWKRMSGDSDFGLLSQVNTWNQQRASAAGLPLRWPADVTLSHTEFKWEGDDRVGFRVQSKVEGPVGSAAVGTWFVVREDGYRIQAVESAPGMLGAQALDWIERGKSGAARRWLTWASELNGSAHRVFREIFASGSGGAAELRWAAAALALRDPRTPGILAQGVDAAPPELKGALYEALVTSHAVRGELDAQLTAARSWVAVDPGSAEGQQWVFTSLVAQGKLHDAEAWALARKPELGFDPVVTRELAQVATNQRRYRDAEFHLRDVIDRGFGNLDTYNQLAWLRLQRGMSMPDDIRMMDKALDRAMDPPPAAAHTLACHLAEQGQVRRAIEITLDRRRRLRGLERDDWYVIGRVLEGFGLDADAREAYARIGEPPSPSPIDTWNLAARRLAKLDGD